KKSTLNRSRICSLIFTALNSEASWNHCRTPGMYWLRQGCRLLSYVTRWTVPLLSGIQTLFVSQNWLTTVPAGALGGRAVVPAGISGVAAGLYSAGTPIAPFGLPLASTLLMRFAGI